MDIAKREKAFYSLNKEYRESRCKEFCSNDDETTDNFLTTSTRKITKGKGVHNHLRKLCNCDEETRELPPAVNTETPEGTLELPPAVHTETPETTRRPKRQGATGDQTQTVHEPPPPSLPLSSSLPPSPALSLASPLPSEVEKIVMQIQRITMDENISRNEGEFTKLTELKVALEEMEKKKQKRPKFPRKLTSCENNNMVEIATDLLYCSWDRFYSASLLLMWFVRITTALLVFPRLAHYVVFFGTGKEFANDMSFIWNPKGDKQKVGFGWFSWNGNVPQLDLPEFLHDFFVGIYAEDFWNKVHGVFKALPGGTFFNVGLMQLRKSIGIAYDFCRTDQIQMLRKQGQKVLDTDPVKVSTASFLHYLYVNLGMFPFAWQFLKHIVNVVLNHIRVLQNKKMSKLLMSLVTLNEDGALMFASFLRRMSLYRHCNEIIPAKISCGYAEQTDGTEFVLLTSAWKRHPSRPPGSTAPYLTIESVKRHTIDITGHLRSGSVVSLEIGDVLHVSDETYDVNRLRRKTQKGDPRGENELQMTFNPGLILRLGDSFFEHIFDVERAALCKNYDPAVCVDNE